MKSVAVSLISVSVSGWPSRRAPPKPKKKLEEMVDEEIVAAVAEILQKPHICRRCEQRVKEVNEYGACLQCGTWAYGTGLGSAIAVLSNRISTAGASSISTP